MVPCRRLAAREIAAPPRITTAMAIPMTRAVWLEDPVPVDAATGLADCAELGPDVLVASPVGRGVAPCVDDEPVPSGRVAGVAEIDWGFLW